jgi:outer membrane usher protein
MLKYPTKTGKPLLLHVLDAAGRALPVGAEVLDTAGNPVTLVGQGSHIFLRTERREGKLEVRWGTGATQRCAFEYRFPSETGTDNPLPRSQSTCVAA